MSKIKFRLEEIKILRSFVWDYNLNADETIPINIKLDINVEFNNYENYFSCIMSFQYDYVDKDEKVINLARFDIIFTFIVEDLQEIIKDTVLKEQLILNIISVAYSTSRGIIFCETKGFLVNKLYLAPRSAKEVYETHCKDKEPHSFNP